MLESLALNTCLDSWSHLIAFEDEVYPVEFYHLLFLDISYLSLTYRLKLKTCLTVRPLLNQYRWVNILLTKLVCLERFHTESESTSSQWCLLQTNVTAKSLANLFAYAETKTITPWIVLIIELVLWFHKRLKEILYVILVYTNTTVSNLDYKSKVIVLLI